MNKREKPPISCRECRQEFCAPCGQFATPIDYKTRMGVCKGCAAREAGEQRLEAGKLLERANAHSLLGAAKMNTLADCLKRVKAIPGATAELGVYKGGSALLIASTIRATQCYLFDTFSGIPFKGENDVHAIGDFKDASIDAVKSLLKDCPNVQYRVGLFPETVVGLEDETYKFVHVDGDQYQTTKDALEYFYPRMVEGGIMLFDDFAWKNCPGVAKALSEFLADKGEGLEYPSTHQAVIVKGKVIDKTVVDVYTSANGIGDAVTALYACCGAAKVGHKVRLHTKQAHWLQRASYPGVEIVTSANPSGIDLNANYGAQLASDLSRKLWYANNLARDADISQFAPVVPHVDRTVREKRIEHKRYAVISPFSAWSSRNWPKSHWQRLAVLLTNAGYTVIAIHGRSETASTQLREYFGSIEGVHWYWGQSPEWVEDVLLGAECFIGNDSGMAHLAAMLGVKTIAVHAQVSPQSLWGQTDVIPVFSDMSCAGCGWQSSKGWRKECDNNGCVALDTISPESVLAAVKNQLPVPVSHTIPTKREQDNRLYYFMHIHKTAGTSFRSWLNTQFKPSELLPAHRCHRFAQIENSINWKEIRLVWGHLGYGILPRLPQKPFLMTFLREPVARVLSHYGHISLDPNTESFDLLSNLSLPEILEKYPEFFSNLQTRNIAQQQMSKQFYLEHDPTFLAQSTGQLELAKQRLREDFDFIGITEDYASSMKRLCAITGWTPTVYHHNTNPRRKIKKDYPSSVIERIVELNQDDITLYEYARDLIQSASKERILT